MPPLIFLNMASLALMFTQKNGTKVCQGLSNMGIEAELYKFIKISIEMGHVPYYLQCREKGVTNLGL